MQYLSGGLITGRKHMVRNIASNWWSLWILKVSLMIVTSALAIPHKE